MNKDKSISQPSRAENLRPSWFDVESALRATQYDFGGIATLNLIVKDDEPAQSALIIRACWYPSWDGDRESPTVVIESPYKKTMSGKLDAASLVVIYAMYDRLAEIVKKLAQPAEHPYTGAVIAAHWCEK